MHAEIGIRVHGELVAIGFVAEPAAIEASGLIILGNAIPACGFARGGEVRIDPGFLNLLGRLHFRESK